MFAALTDNEKVLVVAIFVFVLAGILCFVRDEKINMWSRALVAFGLAILALSFIVNP